MTPKLNAIAAHSKAMCRMQEQILTGHKQEIAPCRISREEIEGRLQSAHQLIKQREHWQAQITIERLLTDL